MTSTAHTFRPPANPGQAIERHFEAAQRADADAAQAAEDGFPTLAKMLRRSAAGHRSAITRIAKAL